MVGFFVVAFDIGYQIEITKKKQPPGYNNWNIVESILKSQHIPLSHDDNIVIIYSASAVKLVRHAEIVLSTFNIFTSYVVLIAKSVLWTLLSNRINNVKELKDITMYLYNRV